MSGKKLIIILAVIGVLIAVLALILKFRSPVKESPAISTYPASVPSLPAAARDQHLKVAKPSDAEEIKKLFNSFAGENASREDFAAGVKAVKFSDTAGKPVPLPAVLSAVGAAIPDSLLALTDERDYEIFFCPMTANRKEYGIILYAKAITGRALDQRDYQKISDQMKQWEDAMLRDLRALLFADLTFSESELSQKLQFRDGKARFADVGLPGGRKSSINYKQLGAPVIITSSLGCMNNGIGYFFDIGQ